MQTNLQETSMYDIIIIGGGPAGMTAALYAQRNGKNALIIEKQGFGGQITYSPQVENIPGFASVSGNAFADAFLEQILAQGAEVELETVTSLTKKPEGFLVETEEGGAYEAPAVILATGVQHRLPGLPGEDELIGNGISFCAVCDGDFYKNQTVCVAGGGNSALQEAILLSAKCKKVIILQDLPYFTGEKKLQEVLFARDNVEAHTGVRLVSLLTQGDALQGVEIEKEGRREQVLCDGLFVAIGLIPKNEPFASLAALDAQGYFDSGEDCRTQTPGLFVAGDCRKKTLRQVTTAACDGAVAAIAACRYLDEVRS